ncbi:Programmed cell death 1 ligand 1 [Channa argus]|uniref:Programmed cell death 1 ligand 1 n=1 Tax=Channa argus TaxID=215402 RepID=A0A6G1Q782_CHAAH|nr:Programmed cell death 1 ligand 1 [Channa argus]
MIWIILLLSLTCGSSADFHETQERNNITISWDSNISSDLSLASLVCVFLSEPPKIWYQMINGVEILGSQDQQFAGRIQLDREAMTEGRVNLHVSTITAEDAGNYLCELSADYDKKMMRWIFLDTGIFVGLNVVQNKDGESSEESFSALRFGETPAEDAKRRQQEVPRDSRSIVAPIILAVLIVGFLLWAMLTSPPNLSGDQQEELTQIETSTNRTWTCKLSHVIKSFLHQERIQQRVDSFQV